MKKCYKCNLFKENLSFAKHSKRSDGLQSVCRDCKKLMDKTYYKSHTSQMKEQIKKAQKKRIERIQDKLFQYLSLHPCVDCGEKDIVVLEFDHERDKERNISIMINCGFTWEKILNEIEKCSVRCANCHRRKTAKTLKYRKYIVSGSVAQW